MLLMLIFAGCAAASPENPSFVITRDDARQAIERMRGDPRPLPRPLVIVGGFLDPNLGTSNLRRRFGRITSRDTKIIAVSLAFCQSFEECRRTIVDAVDRACPPEDAGSEWTVEVDVVGMSLGGLAARHAASEVGGAEEREPSDAEPTTSATGPAPPPPPPRRLRIARLFTISSPHAGATLADRVALNQFHRDMRTGSEFITALARDEADGSGKGGYEVYPYVLLNDKIVGEANAATAGSNPWWLSNPPLISSHFAAMVDERIFADIALRLRGEQPFSTLPRAPLPLQRSARTSPPLPATSRPSGQVDDPQARASNAAWSQASARARTRSNPLPF
jgi:hypothetical protein